MRSLATLGGLLVLIVLAIAWKISNQVEAGQEPDKNSGRITLGVIPEDAGETAASEEDTVTPPAGTSAGDSSPASGNQPDPPAKPAEEPAQAEEPSTLPEENGPVTPEPPATEPSTEEPAAPPAEEEIPGLRYTVKEGDTLYGILTRAYGKANQALIDSVAVASDLDDPGRLSPGMTLVLPQVPGFDAPKRP